MPAATSTSQRIGGCTRVQARGHQVLGQEMKHAGGHVRGHVEDATGLPQVRVGVGSEQRDHWVRSGDAHRPPPVGVSTLFRSPPSAPLGLTWRAGSSGPGSRTLSSALEPVPGRIIAGPVAGGNLLAGG